MRARLFRTAPVAVVASPQATILQDLDGVAPVVLFLENMDIAASGRTKFGSKNANIRFVAASAGAIGNLASVVFHAAPAQAFSIDVTAYAVTVNLLCDASGKPIQLASEVIDLINADPNAAALVRASLALGSDGGATLEVAVGTDVTVDLDGGSASSALGSVTVEYSPTGAPDFAGPWVTDSAGGTALSSVSANAVKSYVVANPCRGLRVKIARGSSDSKAVLTGQSARRA